MNIVSFPNIWYGIFGLLVAFIGLVLVTPIFYKLIHIRNFQSTKAKLIAVEKRELYSEGFLKKYKLIAEYQYTVDTVIYQSDAVNILDGCRGQVANFDIELYDQLLSKVGNGYITIWYNPKEPKDSILTNKIYWAPIINLSMIMAIGLFFAYLNF